MDKLTVSTGTTPQGLRTILLESASLRVLVLPEAGARIRQITYKPLEADLLWNHPTLPAKVVDLHSCYDDVWSGGWDELFPNDEPGPMMGHALPDHGELWTGDWQVEPFCGDGVAGMHLRFITPISNFLAEKTLLLHRGSDVLEVQYRLTNQGHLPFPFLWKLHPAFAVSPCHRIDFPPMSVLLEPEFPGTLDGTPPSFPWPHAPLDGTTLDLRRVPDVSSRAVHFFYGTELASGWCGVTNRAQRLAAALHFDPKVFPSSWLFATHGGWRNLNVAVLEPATGYPFRMQPLIDGGRARTLDPGQSLETTVLFSVQEGLTSIGGVEPDGRILPGEEN